MSTKRRFECTITKYSLEYTVDDIRKCALLENINTDFIYMKALISLIKQSVVTLQEHGIKLIRQFIHCDEWNKYLVNKTSWKIISKDDYHKVYLLECNIEEFLINFGVGLGI